MQRVYGLDILRAIAIISVVLIHFAGVLDFSAPNIPYYYLIDGVELFFVLSGFLIGSILIKEYEKESFNKKSIANFWKRRWFRTLPNYYLILLLNIVFSYFGLNNNDFSQLDWKFFLFLQNFDWHFVGFFWESWSLAVEEWFYLLIPLMLFLAHTVLKKIEIKKQHIFLVVILFFLISPLVYRYFILVNENLDRFWWDTKTRKIVTFRLDTIVYGVLGAYIKYYYVDFWKKSKYYFLFLGCLLYWFSGRLNGDVNSLFMKVFHFPYVSLLVLFFIPFFDSIKAGKGLVYKSITHISKISYSMYLIHAALVVQVFTTHFKVETKLESIFVYILMWTVTIIASSLLYKYYEKPITNFRDKV